MKIIRELSVKTRIRSVNEKGNTLGYIDLNEFPVNSFMTEDFRSVLLDNNIYNPMMEIADLYVNKCNRNNGVGSALIDIVTSNNQDAIVFIDACPHHRDFIADTYDELEGEELENWNNAMSNLCKFLESKNFTNVNDKIAGYEFSKVYLYTGSDIGKQLYEIIYSDTQKM